MNATIVEPAPVRFTSKKFVRLVVSLGVLGGLQWFDIFTPGAVSRFFSGPAAHLAGWFVGTAPLMKEYGGAPAWLLEPTGWPSLLVSRACSGFTFFSFAAAFGCWKLWRQPAPAIGRNPAYAPWVALLPGLWLLTIIANAMRVVLSMYTAAFTLAVLGPHYGPIMHEAAGVVVFFPALVCWDFLLGRLTRPRKHETLCCKVC